MRPPSQLNFPFFARICAAGFLLAGPTVFYIYSRNSVSYRVHPEEFCSADICPKKFEDGLTLGEVKRPVRPNGWEPSHIGAHLVEGPASELKSLQLERFPGEEEEDLRAEKTKLEEMRDYGNARHTEEEDPAVALAEQRQLEKEAESIIYDKATQRAKLLSKHEMILRNWSWHDVKPDTSLITMVSLLSEEETRIRNWILSTRSISQRARGIGLGARPQDEERVEQEVLVNSFPSASEGPGVFGVGSWDKWSELLKEWRTGVVGVECEKGEWEDDYKILHDDMMAGRTAPKIIESYCPGDEPCGGLADRLLGITTTFLYGILTGRAVTIHWENPMPFELLFDSPNIDWSYPYLEPLRKAHPIYGNDALLIKREKTYLLQWQKEKLDEFFIATKWFAQKSPWLQIMLNRGLVIRSFSYPNVKAKIHQLGFKADTAFSCLMGYLARPKPAALAFIHEYESYFALPTIFSIGIQVRTGDNSMKTAARDRANTVELHRPYFSCAEQVARRYAKPGQKVVYYLISDSTHLKLDALKHYPDMVIVSGLGVTHTDPLLKIKGSDEAAHPFDGTMDSLVESYAFSGTDFKIITEQSGFGKIATFMRAVSGRTITIFPEHDEDVQEAWRREPGRDNLDCALDSALVSFSTLATQWSLG